MVDSIRRSMLVDSMATDDLKLFTDLFFSQKHLWIAFQETKHLKEFPLDDPEEVHAHFVEAAYDIYNPLEEILLSRLLSQDELETILLVARIALADGKVF